MDEKNATNAIKFYKDYETMIASVMSENMQFYDLPLLLSASIVLIMVRV